MFCPILFAQNFPTKNLFALKKIIFRKLAYPLQAKFPNKEGFIFQIRIVLLLFTQTPDFQENWEISERSLMMKNMKKCVSVDLESSIEAY